MRAVKLDDHGQLTLPAEVRRELGLQPGDTLHVEVEGGVIHLLRPTKPVNRTPGNWPISITDDFDAPLPGFDDLR